MDDQNQFDRDTRKGLWLVLIVWAVGLVAQNLSLYLMGDKTFVIFYPILRLFEISVLGLLLWKRIVGYRIIQIGVLLTFTQVIFERLIISPMTYMAESTIAFMVFLFVISPDKKIFKMFSLLITSIFLLAIGLKTIEPSSGLVITVLVSYFVIYLAGKQYLKMQDSYARLIFQQITESPKYKNVKIAKNEFKEIEDKIQGYLGGEEKFLHSDYTVKSLADDIGVPRTMVSKVLSMGMNTSFSQLLNEYRIDEVKKRLKDPNFSDEKIISIAYDCGFSSKSTFNTLFKKHTGQTPREFRDS